MDCSVILAHGWGLDKSSWDLVVPAIRANKIEVIDFGYYCNAYFANKPLLKPIIGVGHSLGFLWLLNQKTYILDGYVNISGLPRFIKDEDGLGVVTHESINKTKKRLQKVLIWSLEHFGENAV